MCGLERDELRRIHSVTDYDSFLAQITDEERDRFLDAIANDNSLDLNDNENEDDTYSCYM